MAAECRAESCNPVGRRDRYHYGAPDVWASIHSSILRRSTVGSLQLAIPRSTARDSTWYADACPANSASRDSRLATADVNEFD